MYFLNSFLFYYFILILQEIMRKCFLLNKELIGSIILQLVILF